MVQHRQRRTGVLLEPEPPRTDVLRRCLRRLRDGEESFPILLLTARDAVQDRVFGLDSGADDYLTKPFDFTELSARADCPSVRRPRRRGLLGMLLGRR